MEDLVILLGHNAHLPQSSDLATDVALSRIQEYAR